MLVILRFFDQCCSLSLSLLHVSSFKIRPYQGRLSVRSKIQHFRYRKSGNPWEMRKNSDCDCLWVFSSWKKRINYVDTLSMTTIMRLLRDFHRETQDLSTHMCLSRLQKLEEKLKLLANIVSYEILRCRIDIRYEPRWNQLLIDKLANKNAVWETDLKSHNRLKESWEQDLENVNDPFSNNSSDESNEFAISAVHLHDGQSSFENSKLVMAGLPVVTLGPFFFRYVCGLWEHAFLGSYELSIYSRLPELVSALDYFSGSSFGSLRWATGTTGLSTSP